MTESKPPPPARKAWDKDEWSAKAKAKDEEYAEKGKAAEEAMKQGKKPRFKEEDLPKPTQGMQARTEDLGIDKNLNKTILVQTTTTGKGPRGAGFYCDLCNRTLKDSLSYLDHVNSRYHLRHLGQSTHQTRSTLSQVRAKIASLRASTAQKVTASNYDFQARLRAVRDAENAEREKRRQDKKRKREERRQVVEQGGKSLISTSATGTDTAGNQENIAAMMGFGGFGGGKKR